MAIKILLDLCAKQPIGNSKFHGGGEYVKSVFHRLIHLTTIQEILAFYETKEWIDPTVKALCEQHEVQFFDIGPPVTVEPMLS